MHNCRDFLRLQSERSTSERGSFRLVSRFKMFVPFSRNSLDPDREVQSMRSTLVLNMAAEQESLQDHPGN